MRPLTILTPVQTRCARPRLAGVLLALGLAASACQQPAADAPAARTVPLETRADSVAWRLYSFAGGPAVWDALPYLRFDFRSATAGDTTRRPPRRHLWNRMTGDYRLEMQRGDSALVVLFNANTRQGTVYVNGAATADTSFQRKTLERAYGAFINDSYWAFMPTKLFDAGVTRTYVADSSNADREVIETAFAGVGLTPGDHYWLYVDRASGQLQGWRYRLEGMDAPGPFIAWTDWQSFTTPHGTARIAAQHHLAEGRVLYTDALNLPETADAALFTDPTARLE